MENKKNGYICFYKGKRCEIYASTSFEAQSQAVKVFKAKKAWDVSVHLAESGGGTVQHTPDF